MNIIRLFYEQIFLQLGGIYFLRECSVIFPTSFIQIELLCQVSLLTLTKPFPDNFDYFCWLCGLWFSILGKVLDHTCCRIMKWVLFWFNGFNFLHLFLYGPYQRLLRPTIPWIVCYEFREEKQQTLNTLERITITTSFVQLDSTNATFYRFLSHLKMEFSSPRFQFLHFSRLFLLTFSTTKHFMQRTSETEEMECRANTGRNSNFSGVNTTPLSRGELPPGAVTYRTFREIVWQKRRIRQVPDRHQSRVNNCCSRFLM